MAQITLDRLTIHTDNDVPGAASVIISDAYGSCVEWLTAYEVQQLQTFLNENF